jgi:hypothetical protein
MNEDLENAREIEDEIPSENKEMELAYLRRHVKELQELVRNPGWKLLESTFEAHIRKIQDEVMGNATRLTLKGERLDGMQSVQIEAMQKGQARGLMAILAFPMQYVEQAKETIEMLEKVVKMKEDEDAA